MTKDGTVTVDGHAKINLTLDILGLRPDGFHEVSMVMQSIGLRDTLTLARAEDGISLRIDAPGLYGGDSLPADSTNLAWRAADLMQREYGLRSGVAIHLTKRIPIAAGLAGGSADAAAVLRGMNELFGLGLSEEELCIQGGKLGSDIPFCIQGGTMLATGRGEVLHRLPDFPELPVVLAKPKVEISTAWAYKRYDEVGSPVHPDNDAMQKEIKRGDIEAVAKLLCNALESVTIEKCGVIDDYKQVMLDQGAIASMMSGSGPTVFGLARTEERAEQIAIFLKRFTDAEVFVTRTTGRML